MDSNKLNFSVVIPAFIKNIRDIINLDNCINALLSCSYAPIEIIIVDDGSIIPINNTNKKIKIIHQENMGPAYARNVGANNSIGDIIVFVDSDVIVEKNVFEKLAFTFTNEPEIAAVWGTVSINHNNLNIISTYKNLSHYYFTMLLDRYTYHLTTMFSAVKKEFFFRTGGFDASLKTVSVEDVEFGREIFKNDGIIVLDKTIKCKHNHNFTFLELIKNDFNKVNFFVYTLLKRKKSKDKTISFKDKGIKRICYYGVGMLVIILMLFNLLFGEYTFFIWLLFLFLLLEFKFLLLVKKNNGILFLFLCVPIMIIERCSAFAGCINGLIKYRIK
jgi:glycosyltransferase involved in cell wall biosynthesis